jgi:hypothetical protein
MPTMRIRPLTLSVSAVLAAGAISACGGSSGSSSNGVASKSPDGIVTAATQAIQGVKSVHVSGSITSSGTPITLDLYLVAGKGARGTMSSRGLAFQLVSVGQSVYINGGANFWRSFGGAAAAQKLAGKWLKTPATGSFASVGSLTNVQTLFSKVLSGHGSLSKGDTSTLNGQKVVGVRDTSKGGTLFVATTGTPYPVEIRKAGTEAGQVVFDQFNQPFSLSAPASSIDISSLHVQ